MVAAERQLVYCCLLVRGLVLVVQFLLAPFPDHDADAFKPPAQYPISTLDSALSTLFRGFRRWDSVYFTFIAHWGYVYEHCLAFFPLLPAILGSASRLFHPFLSGWLSLDTSILLLGITLNQILVVLCTLQLYRLGLSVLNSPHLSWLAALLFCINPALIFFSTIYTESLFFLLTITALWLYERKSLFLSTLLIAFSIACRSNGLLNLGYIAFSWWSSSFGAHSRLIWNEKIIRSVRSSGWQLLSNSAYWWFILLSDLLHCLGLLLFGFLPFVAFQLFSYLSFCPIPPSLTLGHLTWLVSLLSPTVDQSVLSFANVSNFRLTRSVVLDYGLPASTPPAWCVSTPPLSYSHIQRTYWQVGFLTYYEWKQLPNFLLTMPIILLSMGCVASFYAQAPRAYKTLGLRAETPHDCRLVPYVFHLLFLTVYGITHINIQVLTRMILSSCPIIYWYCAYLLINQPPWEHPNSSKKKRPVKTTIHRVLKEVHGADSVGLDQILQLVNPMRYPHFKQRLLLTYFLSYAISGTILHVKFLPWT